MRPTDKRALLIAPMLPDIGGNGLAIRLSLFAEALARVARTDVLCIPVFGNRGQSTWVEDHLGLQVEIVDPTGREETLYRLALLSPDPGQRLAAFRRYGRSSLDAKLSLPVLEEVRRFAAGRYDFVHVARGYLMRAGVAAAGEAKLTVDLDEDDAWSWRSIGRIRESSEAARWDRAEAAAADRALRELWPRFHSVFVSGPADGRQLARRHAGLHPVVVPNPAPAMSVPTRQDDGRTVLFVGSFGYRPNVDGLAWLTREIWPLVRQTQPALRLRIVGRDLPAQFRMLDGRGGVETIGAVDDLEGEYAAASLAIGPLRAGGGTRIKLIEAAALAVPIVATPLAARGLAFGSARGMWLADTAQAFAIALAEALDDTGERARRAVYARAVVERDHDRSRLVEQLSCRFAALLGT